MNNTICIDAFNSAAFSGKTTDGDARDFKARRNAAAAASGFLTYCELVWSARANCWYAISVM